MNKFLVETGPGAWNAQWIEEGEPVPDGALTEQAFLEGPGALPDDVVEEKTRGPAK